MSEEMVADARALDVARGMKLVKSEARKLELKTLRDVIRAARQLEAECDYYVAVRLLQGGGKSQHRKGR